MTSHILSTATDVPNGSRNLSKDDQVSGLMGEESTHCSKLMLSPFTLLYFTVPLIITVQGEKSLKMQGSQGICFRNQGKHDVTVPGVDIPTSQLMSQSYLD